MLRTSTHSDSFVDCLPRGGRILPRRILMGATTWVLPRCRTCTGLKRNENSMSGRNGDRSRFHRQRRAKLHDRTRIRELRKTVTAQEAGSGAKVRIKTGLMLLPDTGRKYDSKSSGISDGSEIR